MNENKFASALTDDDLDLVVGGVGFGGGVASIDSNVCVKCGVCIKECPNHAISENYHVDQNSCIGCGTCKSACPAEAIRM